MIWWDLANLAFKKARTMTIPNRFQLTWNDGLADDHEALEQLCDDIFDLFPRGLQRDVWLAWLGQLAADVMWQESGNQRTVH
jgi:hypothetical protein